MTSPPPSNQIIINWSDKKPVFEDTFQYGVISFAVVLITLVTFNSHHGRSSRIKCLRSISHMLLKIKFSSKIKRNLLLLIVWIASTLSDLMATYTIGTNDYEVLTWKLYLIWSIFLYYISCCDRFVIPSFKDIEKNVEKYIDLDDLINLRNIYQGYLLFVSLTRYSFLQALLLLWCSSGFKVLGRFLRVSMARRGDALVSRYMVNYVRDENHIDTDTDTDSMQGYRYPLITGAGFKAFCLRDTGKTITVTIDEVWQCRGQLLSSGDWKSAQLKDLCLSFAMFNLLRRRFHGFALVEASLEKTKDLVLRGLLSREDDLQRAFRVVEVELGFLYDFFYKRLDITFYFAFLLALMGSIGVLVASSWLFLATYPDPDPYLIPKFLALSIALLEIWQLCNHACSDWTKVMLLTMYVRKPSWHNSCMAEKLIGFICKTRPIFRPLHLMLGQYSLLQSFNRIYTYTLRYGVFVNPIQGDMIKLRDEVKVAVLRSLKSSHGELSNGKSSLLRNGVDQKFSWVYHTLKTSSEIIWVWHIATSMCEIASPGLKFHSCLKSESFLRGDEYNLVVAVSLSRYCAYLAVFAHELLPDEQSDPWSTFRKLRLESSEKLRDLKSMNEKLDQMKQMGMSEESSENNTLFMSGIKLGQQLLEETENESERWRILADLWAELMLYLAPSEELTAHVDHLADGREFITYLWVLLTHAGILKRP
ncbi:hypothetical protein DsansV1_C13g0125941 [Dioscorea sansibarensis]